VTSWLVLLALAGILLGSAGAKTLALTRGTLDWPAGPVLSRWSIPAPLVIALEVATAGVSALVPWAWPLAGLVAAAYGILALVAVRLRGRSCACFGASSGPVGSRHIALNLVAAAIALVLAASAGGASPPLEVRVLTVVLIGALVATWSVTGRPGRGGRPAADRTAGDLDCLATARSIVILTVEGCAACRSLHVLLDGTGTAVRWRTVNDPAEPYARLAGGQYPCALAVDATGMLACPPQWGLRGIQRLVHRFLTVDLQRPAA
jgi:hypothetical protein